MLQILPQEILQRTIYNLQREFSEEVPGLDFPSASEGISNMIYRTANILDTIASIQNVNSQEISIEDMMKFGPDPNAVGDPWQTATTTSELGKLEEGPKYRDTLQQTQEDYEELKEKQMTQETEINRIMDFILQNQDLGIEIPSDKTSQSIKLQ